MGRARAARARPRQCVLLAAPRAGSQFPSRHRTPHTGRSHRAGGGPGPPLGCGAVGPGEGGGRRAAMELLGLPAASWRGPLLSATQKLIILLKTSSIFSFKPFIVETVKHPRKERSCAHLWDCLSLISRSSQGCILAPGSQLQLSSPQRVPCLHSSLFPVVLFCKAFLPAHSHRITHLSHGHGLVPHLGCEPHGLDCSRPVRPSSQR